MGLLGDLILTLRGRSAARLELQRIRREWTELLLEITNVMEKQNQLAGRLAKRESRELAKTLNPDPVQAPVAAEPSNWKRRAAILRARRGPQPTKTQEVIHEREDQSRKSG